MDYEALGEVDGEVEGELDGVFDTELDGELDGELDTELEGDDEGDDDGELEVSSRTSNVPMSVSIVNVYLFVILLYVVFTVPRLSMVIFAGRSADAKLLYFVQIHSMIANMIFRMSPLTASASAAVNSLNDASGTVMSVPSSDQLAIQVVGF